MLFNSLAYILLFLPIVVLAYNIVKRYSATMAKLFMICASAYFYTYISYNGVLALALSCIVSWCAYLFINTSKKSGLALALGISVNVIMLCAIKYNHFIPEGASYGTDWLHLYGMPLAVSFFTFQQISFLVDAYHGKVGRVSVLDYLYYILFFPKLIAGPITRWQSLMPQVSCVEPVRSSMMLLGLSVISIGLFKKVVLSGIFSKYADIGYANINTLTFIESWITSLSYTAQIYFDFSGYSDIAIGSALLLGIRLPDNFNSPYMAVNIRDFWNRWHISLSTWLRDYIYIPLGGSKKGISRTLGNLIITFLISGAWHGSELNFIIWGALHGVATAINVLWYKSGLRMPDLVGWLITFIFINFSWIPFRAESIKSSYDLFIKMLNPDFNELVSWFHAGQFSGMHIINSIFSPGQLNTYSLIYISVALISVFTLKNTGQIINKGDMSFTLTGISAIAFTTSIIFMFGGASAATFIYSAF